jgi:heptosyltransferase-3
MAEPRVTVADGDLAEPWQSEPGIVVFHPWPAGGSLSLREWPEDYWMALAQRLARPDVIFAVTGAPAQIAQSRAFAVRLALAPGVRAMAFEGEGGLVQLVRLLCKARLAVSVNTGIMHLAAVVGIPTVSLNGPTADHRWGPRGRCCVGVSPADGSGGYLHFGFEISPHSVDVMSRIKPDQVAEAAKALLVQCGSLFPEKH